VLAVAGGTVGADVWKAGYVYQWSGIVWEEREIDKYTELYTSCFKDGLDVLANNTEWFGGVIAKRIIAMKAFIEEFESVFVLLKKGGVIQSDSYKKNEKGFKIDSDGNIEFNGGKFRGHIEADSGTIDKIYATDMDINGGNINIGPLHVSAEKIGLPPYTMQSISFYELISLLRAFNDPGSYVSGGSVLRYGGTYNGNAITKITYETINISTGFGASVTCIKQVTFYNVSTKVADITGSSPRYLGTLSGGSPVSTNATIVFNGGGSGATFVLDDLPTSDPKSPGAVWRKENQLMISLI